MYCAILGDVFDNRYKDDDKEMEYDNCFPSLSKYSIYSGDSVMTAALADTLVGSIKNQSDDIVGNLEWNMRSLGRKFPCAGYSADFLDWLFDYNAKPLECSDGGPARWISPVGWLFDSLEETEHIAELCTKASHSHKDDIESAICTAGAIYLGRTGHSKNEILDYVKSNYSYDLDNPDNVSGYVRTCMSRVLKIFFDSNDIKDVFNKSVYYNAGKDKLTSIAGAIAEGFYGRTRIYGNYIYSRLPLEILKRMDSFYEYVHKNKNLVTMGD